MKTASQRGASNRTKGHSFERLIARQLREFWPDARRGLQYQDGHDCPDVVGTPFFIECKRMKKITDGFRQKTYDDTFKSNWRSNGDFCGIWLYPDGVYWEDNPPRLVVTKADREPILVTIDSIVYDCLCKYRKFPNNVNRQITHYAAMVTWNGFLDVLILLLKRKDEESLDSTKNSCPIFSVT